MAINVSAVIDSVVGGFVDEDNAYGVQCADIAMFWSRYVFGTTQITRGATIAVREFFDLANDNWVCVSNGPTNFPPPGSLVIWDGRMGNGYGHVALVEYADSDVIHVLEQDGYNQSAGAYRTTRDYYAVRGWLIPRNVECYSRVTGGYASGPSPIFSWWDVDPGDTLSSIADASGTTVDYIVKRNGIADPNMIRVGERLYLQ